MPRAKDKFKNRKSYLKPLLLNILQNLGEAAFQFIDEGLLNPTYAFTGPSREFLGLNHKEIIKKYRKRGVVLRRNLIAVTLWRLQKEGLVTRDGNRKTARWHLTAIGRSKLGEFIQNARPVELPSKDGKIRIVSFDVPEKERWKRSRLRSVLIASDFAMLQRSLWFGQRPLPHFVFDEIKNLKLRHFVHIFEISERGTIRGLT